MPHGDLDGPSKSNPVPVENVQEVQGISPAVLVIPGLWPWIAPGSSKSMLAKTAVAFGLLALAASIGSVGALIYWYAAEDKIWSTWLVPVRILGFWTASFWLSILFAAACWLRGAKPHSVVGRPWLKVVICTYLIVAAIAAATGIRTAGSIGAATYDYDMRKNVVKAFSDYVAATDDYSRIMGTWRPQDSKETLTLANGYIESTSSQRYFATVGGPPTNAGDTTRGTWNSLTPSMWVAGPAYPSEIRLTGGVSHDGHKMWVYDGSSLKEFARAEGR